MKKYTYLTFLLVSVLLMSCNKKNQNYLIGEWELLTKPDSIITYKWIFTDDKVYVMATDANENEEPTGEIDTCSSGSYILKNGILTLGLPERPCKGSVYNGDWDIQALNENVMALRRETKNGTEWYEFQKVTQETEEEE
jgi:hypothetical protein